MAIDKEQAGTILDHAWDYLIELEFIGIEPVNGTWQARQTIADARMRLSTNRATDKNEAEVNR